MRSISRVVGVSINTVGRELVIAGEACIAFHDEKVRAVKAARVQVDEVWSFCYSKEANAPKTKKQVEGRGDVWTWTGLCADSKLIISWTVGRRDGGTAYEFLSDLKDRLANRVQLTSDGLRAYVAAVGATFGDEVDYAQLVKLYGQTVEGRRRYSPPVCIGAYRAAFVGNPDPQHISTSYVERQNLNIRMGARRLTRLTNAFSKRLANHRYALAIYFVWYNWGRKHMTLKTTPAIAANASHAGRIRDVVSERWLSETIDRVWDEVKSSSSRTA